MRNNDIRPPAVAGTFYPAHPPTLQTMVLEMLAGAAATDGVAEAGPESCVKAIIAPHAGFRFSGPVAASAFRRLGHSEEPVKRIILVGPAHFVPVDRLAICDHLAFSTPLGNVRVDDSGRNTALAFPQVVSSDPAHEPEHSLEVELPFLQTICADFTIVPLLAGQASGAEVAEVLEALWGGPETRIVISSDLSHFLDHRAATAKDKTTAEAIVALQSDRLTRDTACGRIPIQGLLLAAQRRNLAAEAIDLRNSGDTAGPKDRVVGYGAFTFTEPVGS